MTKVFIVSCRTPSHKLQQNLYRLKALSDIEKDMREDEQKIYKLSSLQGGYDSIKKMLKR